MADLQAYPALRGVRLLCYVRKIGVKLCKVKEKRWGNKRWNIKNMNIILTNNIFYVNLALYY